MQIANFIFAFCEMPIICRNLQNRPSYRDVRIIQLLGVNLNKLYKIFILFIIYILAKKNRTHPTRASRVNFLPGWRVNDKKLPYLPILAKK